MTDPEKVEAVTSAAAEDARDNRAHRILLTLGITGLAGVLLLVGALVWQGGTISSQGSRIDALVISSNDNAQQAERLAQQVRSLGGTPVVEPAAPGPQGPEGRQGVPGPGPTQEQINESVAAWLAVHPPGPTPADVALAVAGYLTAHPPAPGAPPTPEQIAAAAASYIAAHASQFQGQPGQPGRDATDAQVASAVAAYCGTHNGCAGPAGPAGTNGAAGAQGVSVVDLVFQRDSTGTCQAVITLHDPATGKDATLTHQAGDAACPLIAPKTKGSR